MADRLHLVVHAAEHLDLHGVGRQVGGLQGHQSGGQAADVVRSEGQLDARFAGSSGRRIDEVVDHPFEAGVGIGLASPDRFGPAVHVGVDDLLVPVGALHQPDGYLPSDPSGPVDDSSGVGLAAAQVGLHRKAGLEVVLLAASLEQRQGQILERVVLHVEVDEDAVSTGLFEDGTDHVHQSVERAVQIDRIGSGVERADLDRHVGAGNRPQMICFEDGVRSPRTHGRGKGLHQIEVALLVGGGLLVAHAGLTKQIDREAHSLLPHLGELRKGGRRIGAGNEPFGHRGDASRDHLGHGALEQAARAQAESHARRQGDSGLGQIVHEMLVDLFRCLQGREGVDETEQLDLEALVLHGPVHQLVGPEGGGEHSLLGSTHRFDQFRTDFVDAAFACLVVPAVVRRSGRPGCDRHRLRFPVSSKNRHGRQYSRGAGGPARDADRNDGPSIGPRRRRKSGEWGEASKCRGLPRRGRLGCRLPPRDDHPCPPHPLRSPGPPDDC